MALVQFGAGIVGMSGKVGGSVFSKNKSGAYVRAWSKPTNPNTAKQQVVRNVVAVLSARWAQTLSAAQRTAWNLYGSNVVMKNNIGAAIHLSGYNHYIRSNAWFARMERALVDDGPIVFELPAKDPTMSITASEGTQLVTMTFDDTLPWCSEDNAMLTILQGAPQNPQINFFGGPFSGRSAKVGAAGVPVTSPLDYASIHVVSETQRFWSQFRILRADGRLSEAFEANCFCGA